METTFSLEGGIEGICLLLFLMEGEYPTGVDVPMMPEPTIELM